MPATDPQSLFAASTCYDCFGMPPRGTAQWFRLALLQTIANQVAPTVATDPQSLLSAANCYACYGNGSLADLMELALLSIIANNTNAAGPGAGGVFAGNYGGNPPPFTPTTAAAIATDTSTGRQWNWFNGVWQ